jgi:UDP-N-acetylglucosamine transferase subunit ALG13
LPVEYNNFFSQINADQQKACLVVPSQLSNEQVLVKRVFEKFIDQYGNDPSTIASKIATMVGKINNYLTGEVAKSGQNITLINRLNFYKLLSIKKIQKLQLQSSSSSFNAQSLNDQFTQFNITDF